jgi:hypothetical protein
MPSHQPGAQRPDPVDESRGPVHRADPSPRPVNESRSPADQGSDFDSKRNPRLRLVDQESDLADQRRRAAAPQGPPPGAPTNAGDTDRPTGRRLVGPPERRRWGRAARPPDDDFGTGKIPRRPDDSHPEDP